MDETTFRRLHAAALDARDKAYAPYSGFLVGAAVSLADGTVVTAANMENASYGLSLCAEALALGRAAADGRLGEVAALLVTGGPAETVRGAPGKPVTPCGRCRQLLAEAATLGGRDFPVAASDLSGERRLMLPVSGWLPHAFDLGAPA